MKDSKQQSKAKAKSITDSRFASFETDPRYRLPSRKHTKTTIDKRFSRMLNDDDFTATSKVDRYGRKIKTDAKKEALRRLYQEEDEGEEDEDAADVEVEDDDVVQRELRKAEQNYDPARGGGFSSSEDEDGESDEDGDSDEDDGGVAVSTDGDMQRLQDEQGDVESGEVTNRIAIVNLDWDHIRSEDLMALFSSFLASGSDGRIEQISIYPSEFGKERMQQEEIDGPPKELFKDERSEDSDSDSEADSEDQDERIKETLIREGNDQEFDNDALRKYQLDRLRYYYAVMICSNAATAQRIYEATDGTEYQSSSNFLDLRFVPDDVAFDDEPRDECKKIPDSYKPVEFVTNALQSSKVKLTWDMHPEEASRKEALKRAFSGSRNELEENDLKAYLASDSEDSNAEVSEHEEEMEEEADEAEAAPKLSKKELARQKMREALGLSDSATTKGTKDGPVGDMQITFAPALEANDETEKEGDAEETTIEKYKRRERERKEKKRTKAKAKREGLNPDGDGETEEVTTAAQNEGEDLGFDDPFFTTGTDAAAAPSKSSIRKEERLKKRQAREAAEAASASERAHLKKVMASSNHDDDVGDSQQAKHLDHFDMNDIVRAEKAKRKKGKSGKRQKKGSKSTTAEDGDDAVGLQADFKMDVGDKRFKAVFDSHEYAIDPSNPKFKKTEGMNKLLEEGRRKRRMGDEGESRGSKKRR